MKTKKPKRKNAQDTTLRNNRARKKEIEELKKQIVAFTHDLIGIFRRLERLEDETGLTRVLEIK